MTLKQLTTFYWVVRLGGFATAAERLHTTQSAVSMRMQELEQSLGIELFDRSQRAARLTAKGKELLKYAEQMINITAEIQHRIGDPQTLTGTIGLGATEIVAISWLPSLVAAIHEACPGIVLRLDIDAAINQARKLDRGAIDVAIIPEAIDDRRYEAVSVGWLDFDWMASPKLGISDKVLSPRELQKWPLLTLAPGSISYKQLDRWFEENDASIDRWDVCNSLGVLAALAAAGLGVSYLPRGFYASEIAGKRLKLVNVKPTLPGLEYFVVFEKRLAPPVAHLIGNLAQLHTTFRRIKGGVRKPTGKRKGSSRAESTR